jgi:hypothetical protein|tara:strand:+ start:1567 stop:1959 length:393 start_codon:yes stop_codon:yes gene_type:complete
MISITITPSTSAHIDILAAAMRNIIACTDAKLVSIEEPLAVDEQSEAPAPDPVAKAKAPKPVKLVKSPPAQETAPPSEITIEEVRAKLSELSASGKTVEVKALLNKFGAFKLPDLEPHHFAEVLEKAGEL